jgi:DnaJ-class molecular chaperone
MLCPVCDGSGVIYSKPPMYCEVCEGAGLVCDGCGKPVYLCNGDCYEPIESEARDE